MIKNILLILSILTFPITFANTNPILVTESTISLNFDETEELFFSFAEGDIIEFDFEMVKGKNLKEIEVYELPNNRIFSEFKAEKFSKNKFILEIKDYINLNFIVHLLLKEFLELKSIEFQVINQR